MLGSICHLITCNCWCRFKY